MAYLEILTTRALRTSIQPDGKLRIEPDWLITDDVRQMMREHRKELIAEIMASRIAADSTAEVVPDYHILWVATDLDSFEEYDPRFGYEMGCEPVYRMLDAPYYAWLRHRMENVRKSHEVGGVSDSDFDALRERFNIVHDWAVQHIGEDALRRAIRTTNVKTYVPPSEQTFAAYQKIWDDAWDTYERRRTASSHVAQSDQAGRLHYLLATQGYAGIRSAIIEDIVVFVRDDSVVVPAKWADKVRFTMEELKLMTGSSPEAVKQIYEVKRTFGGKVMPADDDPFGGTATGNQQSLFTAATGTK